MEEKQALQSPCAACGSPILERNRYFTGKFMTARDFQGEQDYLRNRHHLHNRLLHGWGVLRGLDVEAHPRSECQGEAVLVRAGAALDCWGRELLLLEDTPVELPVLRPERRPQEMHDKTATEQLLLCVFFTEDRIEFTPAIYHEGATESDSEESNRIREGVSLRLLRLDQVDESCWQRGAKHKRHRDDCEDRKAGQPAVIEPDCPCGDGVPLALLSYSPDGNGKSVQIDLSGRRHLPISPDFLTHIVHVNWEHGGHMTLAHLRDKLRGRLEITFDRKIRPATENRGAGVSEYTFHVQFGGVQEDIRYLPFSFREPPAIENENVAVFHIDPRYLDGGSRDDMKDKMVYITLKCDFIIDCRGMPVDGAHLGGSLPTHSGRMGGDFQSWFYVTEREEDVHRRFEGRIGGERKDR